MNRKLGAAGHKPRTDTAIVICPDCREKLVLQGTLRISAKVWCHNCEAELEVVNLTPVEVHGVSLEPRDEREFLARW